MKRQCKNKLITMLSILTASILLTGCSMGSVLSGTIYLKKSDAKEFTVEKSVVDPITQMNINTSVAKVEVIPSDNFYVEINYLYWNEEPEYTLKDGILSFDDNAAFPNSYSINFDLDNSIRVYLPEDAFLSIATIESSSDNVSIGGFAAEKLDVTVSYGDLSMQDVAAVDADIVLSSGSSDISDSQIGKLEFTDSYGNAKFTNINTDLSKLPVDTTFDEFNVDLSSGDVTVNTLNCASIKIHDSYGNITCDKFTAEYGKLELESGDLELGQADIANLEVKNSYGDVELGLIGTSANYGLDLNTSYGKIKVAEKNYEGSLVVENGGTKNVIAKLSSGDINVDFKE